jgi:hypothetical protein
MIGAIRDYDDARIKLQAGKKLFWRECSICLDAMHFVYNRSGSLHLVSCKCRPSGQEAPVAYSWTDLDMLVTHGEVRHV